MPYQARRNDEYTENSTEHSNRSNANNVRNAADIALATKNPYAVAAGGAVKAADKLTGGKSSDELGKMLTKANQMAPGGKKTQDILDALNDSGLSDKLGKSATLYNSLNNNPNPTEQNDNKKANNRSNNTDEFQDNNNQNEDNLNGKGAGSGNIIKKIAIFAIAPAIIIIFFFVTIISIVTPYADFEDALGASYVSGEETGSFTEFQAVTKEAQKFYERINEVKLEFAKEEKAVESVRIVAVYHIMASENNKFTYRRMTKSKIREIANTMFKDKVYDEETFKENLVNSFFKKNFPTYDKAKRLAMTERVLKYIKDYYNFLGTDSVSCTDIGSCSYQIEGFYYPSSKGNYYLKKSLEFNNLKVRLMQTGFANNHDYGGTFGKALEGEELVPFEDYVIGVAYFIMDDDAPDEALKAELVAARSFALARASSKGNGRALAQDKDGQWILQIANSTADQGFCNPDLGCSSNSQRWGQIHSGQEYTGWKRSPLARDSKLRKLANEVIGEVLANEEGNIIATGYNSAIHENFIKLANEGYDYKQILLQVYNNTSPAGATEIKKMTCSTTGNRVCNQNASGPYNLWKQYEGPWASMEVGDSNQSVKAIGCAATSVAILIAKSGVPTTIALNPGNFVATLNSNNGFGTANCPGCIKWPKASIVAPSFKYVDMMKVSGYSKEEKFNTLKNLLSERYYVTAEVKGDTGSHWVAIDGISGNNITMIDPGSTSTNLWQTYPWYNTSRFVYYKVG